LVDTDLIYSQVLHLLLKNTSASKIEEARLKRNEEFV